MQLRFSFALFYVGELYDSTQYPQNGSPPHNIITKRICQKGHQIQKIIIFSLQCNGGSFAVRPAITLQRGIVLSRLGRVDKVEKIESGWGGEQEKKTPGRRHGIHFIILFRFKATAERRQWSSAASKPRLKTCLKLWLHFWMAKVPSHQTCLLRSACRYSGEAAWERFAFAASSNTLRTSRLAPCCMLWLRHRSRSEHVWQSALLAV